MTACEADNGRAALDWLASNPVPGLILLDLMMPEMDGFEFLRELRRTSRRWRDVPVIVVTAKELTAGGCATILSGQTRRSLPRTRSI